MAVAFDAVATSSGAASLNVVLTKPAGLVVGELMVALFTQGVAVGTDDVNTAPSGWTYVGKIFSTEGEMLYFSWKVADSGDVAASNFTWAMTASHVYHGHIASYTGAHTTAPFPTSAHYALNTNTASTTATTSTITPTVDNCLIVGYWAMGSGSATWNLDGTLASRYNASLQSLPVTFGDVLQGTAAAVSKVSTITGSAQTTAKAILAIAPSTGGAPDTTDPITDVGLWDEDLVAPIGWF